MSDRELILIGFSVVLALLLVVVLLFLFRRTPPPNVNQINNQGSANAQTHIQQNRYTQTNIQINPTVTVNQNNQGPAHREPTRSNGNKDDALGLVVVAGLAILVVAFFYLKHFDAIVVLTRALYVAVISFALASSLAALVLKLDDVPYSALATLAAPMFGSALAIVLLFSAQSLITPDITEAAAVAPNNLSGAVNFYLQRLTDSGRHAVLGSAFSTCVLLIHGVIAGLTVLRGFVLTHLDVQPNDLFAHTVLNLTEWCSASRYSWTALGLLGISAFFIYVFTNQSGFSPH
jgi:hypothetical protein